MPRFYFSISDHGHLEDEEGTELPDVDAARRHAYAVAREIMRNRAGMLGDPWSKWTMQVKDSHGKEVFCFELADAGETFTQDGLRNPDKSVP
jgi:hypothetical protein